MATGEQLATVDVMVENIGGIDDTEVSLTGGVSILAGRNATNRTSFLRALMAGLGSREVALKGDADEGYVEFDFGDETYRRTLSRRQGSIVFDGDPYLEDPEYADLYACLLESNPARQAVERGDELYDVIMQPVDTDRIDAEIEALQAERDELSEELASLESVEAELPELEAERAELEEKIEAKRAALEDCRAALAAVEAEGEAADEIESRFAEVREVRNDLEDARQRIEEEERLRAALEVDRDELVEQLDGLAEVDSKAMERLEAEIDRHRSAIERLESSIEELESVITFNQSMLTNDDVELAGLAGEAPDEAGPVTDRLVGEGAEITCWTCGSRVEREAIERTVSALQEAYGEKVEELSARRDEVDEAESERRHLERTRDRQRELERDLEEVEAELKETDDQLDRLHAESAELEATLEELEAELDGVEPDADEERLALLQEQNELEFELDRLESRLAEVDAEIADAEAQLEDRPALEAELERVTDEIEELRSRIERLEAESVELFNEQMDTITGLLGFDNLERVWIERTAVGESGEAGTTFELHVVRSTGSGTVYEDTIDHLSESERELVGLVFALAGYLVHEVYEQVPFMLLDSLEAFDSDRLSTLIDYLAEYADHLVVALLPEDAAALDDSYQRVTDI